MQFYHSSADIWYWYIQLWRNTSLWRSSKAQAWDLETNKLRIKPIHKRHILTVSDDITHRLGTFKPSILFCGTQANSVDPDQMPQNVASDQVLHCLLTESIIKI